MKSTPSVDRCSVVESAFVALFVQARSISVADAVGVAGWVLPHVYVIDGLGLNDRVVAHTPVRTDPDQRRMAHDRHPPPGYVECFHPNVAIGGGTAVAIPRSRPFTAEAITACESRFAALAGRG